MQHAVGATTTRTGGVLVVVSARFARRWSGIRKTVILGGSALALRVLSGGRIALQCLVVHLDPALPASARPSLSLSLSLW